MIEKLRKIKAVAFDFDGVFTDNKVYVDERGLEQVRCDRGDGMGISMLRKTDLLLVVISTERNEVVAARCKKLKLNYMQAIDDKPAALANWLKDSGLTENDCAFIGNDINDLACLQAVGLSVCPADAHFCVRDKCDIVLTRNGGDAAVREFCDLYLQNADSGCLNPYN